MTKTKIILGIETSCDETAAAIMQKNKDGVHILSNVVASSAALQAKYGGIIPEQAAREQLKSIILVIQEALSQAFPLHPKPYTLNPPSIDSIAVTQGPGLIGSLLVGVETAKTLALTWNKPLVPMNHLMGHFYANWIGSTPTFPAIGLLVSGGHTDLILMTGHGKYKYLGGTRDDAAGEAFDKTARLLDLPYPGGPAIAQRANEFKIKNARFKITLPRPLLNEDSLDFSFSGLKTAIFREVEKLKTTKQFNNEAVSQLAFETQEAIVDVLVTKTIKAAQTYKVDQILVAGGVAANQKLSEKLRLAAQKNLSHVRLFIPPPSLCTDNAAFIATAAFYNYHPVDPLLLQANPNLSLTFFSPPS